MAPNELSAIVRSRLSFFAAVVVIASLSAIVGRLTVSRLTDPYSETTMFANFDTIRTVTDKSSRTMRAITFFEIEENCAADSDSLPGPCTSELQALCYDSQSSKDFILFTASHLSNTLAGMELLFEYLQRNPEEFDTIFQAWSSLYRKGNKETMRLGKTLLDFFGAKDGVRSYKKGKAIMAETLNPH